MTSTQNQVARTADTLHLPRILCLHGGGTNARIFRAQCRVLVSQLGSQFRFVFADGPFHSDAGPDVLSAYKTWGPFRRWLRWKPEHPDNGHYSMVAAIERSVNMAMKGDDLAGASGEWVGMLGFSQGAKIAASLLLRHQIRMEKLGSQATYEEPEWRFGVLMAGRGPLVAFDPDLVESMALVNATFLSVRELPDHLANWASDEHMMRMPTLHVHGTRDPGLELHQKMWRQYAEPEASNVLQWEGNHRVPVKSKDVAACADAILDTAEQAGVTTH